MSSITSGLTSSFYSAANNTQSIAKPIQSSQSVSKPSTAMSDVYIPGTEGESLREFYHIQTVGIRRALGNE
ncbi:MAG: hypothetical protein LBT05_03985 [Planctomycetaceae bacterium]|nr:hypothetical protein [Planctomycetaceae bacterium]